MTGDTNIPRLNTRRQTVVVLDAVSDKGCIKRVPVIANIQRRTHSLFDLCASCASCEKRLDAADSSEEQYFDWSSLAESSCCLLE